MVMLHLIAQRDRELLKVQNASSPFVLYKLSEREYICFREETLPV